jgi:Zn-dependent protease
MIIAITFHQAAHGFVAHWLGDDTTRRLGRVSLNPIRHIDPLRHDPHHNALAVVKRRLWL